MTAMTVLLLLEQQVNWGKCKSWIRCRNHRSAIRNIKTVPPVSLSLSAYLVKV